MGKQIFVILLAAVAILASTATASTQPVSRISDFVGVWDVILNDLAITLRVHDDNTVDHSLLGSGDIKHDNANYFNIAYRHRSLLCHYTALKTQSGLALLPRSPQDSTDCRLGQMAKRAKESSASDRTDAAASGKGLEIGKVFKDCPVCPDVVVIPSGSFIMGLGSLSARQENGAARNETPSRTIVVQKQFAVSRYAITRDQFENFVATTGHQVTSGCYGRNGSELVKSMDRSFRTPGFNQASNHPVVCVSWHDAVAFTNWLTASTKVQYRLLSEAEREYVARAATSTKFWWGDHHSVATANYSPSSPEPSSRHGSGLSEGERAKLAFKATMDKRSKIMAGSEGVVSARGTVPVDRFAPNPFGLFQVHGNVAEWTLDCWNRSYHGLPNDMSPAAIGDCSRRVIRGGGWTHDETSIGSAFRESVPASEAFYDVGFRVARDF